MEASKDDLGSTSKGPTDFQAVIKPGSQPADDKLTNSTSERSPYKAIRGKEEIIVGTSPISS